jgi:hypothetical protein
MAAMRTSTPDRAGRAAATDCGHCRRFSIDAADKMAAQGYGRCAHQPVWEYRAPGAACAFNPPKFEARA